MRGMVGEVRVERFLLRYFLRFAVSGIDHRHQLRQRGARPLARLNALLPLALQLGKRCSKLFSFAQWW
jgi:hypothetical protein